MHWDERKKNEQGVPSFESRIPHEAEYYYATGTARPHAQRTGVVVLLSLLVILLCTLVLLLCTWLSLPVA